MMKFSQLIMVIGLVLANGLANTALAHDIVPEHHGERHQRPHQPFKRMLSDLDLTDSQRQQIEQLLQQHRSEKLARHTDQAEQQQLHALLDAKQFDESAARQIIQQHQAQQLDRRVSQLQLQHQLRQILTDEQRATLDQKRATWQHSKQRQPV